ncbi:protein SAD1/UNC-84 domain protein 2-like [Iris pallida]|uniref:Protein SAD1/UNC-84 domain protein 2-like n=1 Tax=Iris pallida TaxID=29817 RepID=A0AAX6ELG0_IRIPA|nr:protein SAD1/UNC-84 domain protein 2-like [Iris pallida]KAJ6841949.1 protein SAD1/UNC-84 domain protein 2-like [Iris pallida]
MSASTENANPKTETRRRSVAKTRINGEAAAAVVGNGAPPLFEREDLSHSILGETVVERPRDVPESRRAAAVAAGNLSPTPVVVSYHRRKKSSSRPGTPKWQTVLSVLTKLCLLVLGLVGLGKMILQLGNTGGGEGNYPFAALDQDGRISELESFIKKTAKMFQVQLDVMDKKIDSEIGGSRRELSKVEEKNVFLEEELKKLEARTDDFGKSLGELKELDFLTKEEFESFKSELKKRGSHGEEASLDNIGALAKEIVEKEIERHAADGLGRVDYALASGGARVTMHSEPFVSGKASWFPVGKDRSRVHPNAQKMLEPSFGEPGQCFALKGSGGFVEIRLRTAIILQAVTLEHVSKSVAYDRSSAPKDCTVSAWIEGQPGEPRNSDILTKFSYDLEKSNAQTFDMEMVDVRAVNVVRLEFTSNHGNPTLTCIYRFRVHGHEHEHDTHQFEYPNSLEGERSI